MASRERQRIHHIAVESQPVLTCSAFPLIGKGRWTDFPFRCLLPKGAPAHSISTNPESFPFGNGSQKRLFLFFSNNIIIIVEGVKPSTSLSWTLEKAAPSHSDQEAPDQKDRAAPRGSYISRSSWGLISITLSAVSYPLVSQLKQ